MRDEGYRGSTCDLCGVFEARTGFWAQAVILSDGSEGSSSWQKGWSVWTETECVVTAGGGTGGLVHPSRSMSLL